MTSACETERQAIQDVLGAWEYVMMSASVDDDGGCVCVCVCVCAVAV